jgi:hypothetical protein
MKSPVSDRDIRAAFTEMNDLIAERKRIGDRVRRLKARIKRELRMEPGDFMLSMKLANKAQESESKAAATLNTVRRIFLALGRAVPVTVIEAQSGQPKVLSPIKSEIFDLVKSRGPATSYELRQANKPLAERVSLSTHLSQMKRQGIVAQDQDGKWSLPNTGAES